jgi:hypothetical protein
VGKCLLKAPGPPKLGGKRFKVPLDRGFRGTVARKFIAKYSAIGIRIGGLGGQIIPLISNGNFADADSHV